MAKPNQYRGDLLAHLIRWGIAPAWACWERSAYLRELKQLRRRQFDPVDKIVARQQADLRAIVLHAFDTTDFYRRRFQAANVDPRSMRFPDDFRTIPLLTKNDLRTQQAAMLSPAFANSPGVHRFATSGSTGVAVEVVVDDAAQQFRRACTVRSDEWSGWRLGEPAACLWGNPGAENASWRSRLRNRFLARQRFLDTLKIDDNSLRQFVEYLRRQPPSLLFGHAHSLFLLAEYCANHGGPGFQPRGIISTAMVLHAWERKRIEEVFGRAVTNRYGCEEVALIACQCERGGDLHINADNIYLEILRADGTPCQPGEIGSVVVTDLSNRAMPIIRYQIGDMAAMSDKRCPCGRGLASLERVEGRIADYVVTPGGECVSGISLTDHFGTIVPGIVQLQIVQESVEHLRFIIVRGPEYDAASESQIGELVVERFGPSMTFTTEFVARIPAEPSGKYRFCISKVPNPFSHAPAVASSL